MLFPGHRTFACLQDCKDASDYWYFKASFPHTRSKPSLQVRPTNSMGVVPDCFPVSTGTSAASQEPCGSALARVCSSFFLHLHEIATSSPAANPVPRTPKTCPSKTCSTATRQDPLVTSIGNGIIFTDATTCWSSETRAALSASPFDMPMNDRLSGCLSDDWSTVPALSNCTLESIGIGSLFVGQTQISYLFSFDSPVATSRNVMTVTFPIFMRWNSFISREVPAVGEFQASLSFFRSWPMGGAVICDQVERVRHSGNRTVARNLMEPPRRIVRRRGKRGRLRELRIRGLGICSAYLD